MTQHDRCTGVRGRQPKATMYEIKDGTTSIEMGKQRFNPVITEYGIDFTSRHSSRGSAGRYRDRPGRTTCWCLYWRQRRTSASRPPRPRPTSRSWRGSGGDVLTPPRHQDEPSLRKRQGHRDGNALRYRDRREGREDGWWKWQADQRRANLWSAHEYHTPDLCQLLSGTGRNRSEQVGPKRIPVPTENGTAEQVRCVLLNLEQVGIGQHQSSVYGSPLVCPVLTQPAWV